jgi:peptidoglycan/xylan/chitin deacetylase (PgdA/CDA1 family)
MTQTDENRVCVTLDVDWASDAMIDQTARILLEHEVPATWFITHASAAVDRLRDHPELFELGIHPNFLPGSTHGECMV